MGLYNTKYLYKRNKTYYFVIKINDCVIKKSLKTDNLTYANILKLKIKERISQMTKEDIENHLNQFKPNYQIERHENNITLIAENDEERKLLDEMEKTIKTKINRLSKDYKVNKHDNETRDTFTLKKCSDEFLDSKQDITSKDTMSRVNLAITYLLMFFGEKQIVKNINSRDANNFRNFLIKLPQQSTRKKELKELNLKLLIEKKSKILDKYPKLSLRTVEENLKVTRAFFAFCVSNLFIYRCPFVGLSKIKKPDSTKREFKESELKKIFTHLLENDLKEEYNLVKFGLYTGLRKSEILRITTNELNLEKGYIDINGTKTDNAKRIMVLHKDLEYLIDNQVENKKEDDFIFFNDIQENRDEDIGVLINDLMRLVLGDELKKDLGLHSLRKNFSQEIYLSDLFKELDYKTLIGHSTSSDVTDKHYLLGKRDYKKFKEKMDKVSFRHYFAPIKKPNLNEDYETIL